VTNDRKTKRFVLPATRKEMPNQRKKRDFSLRCSNAASVVRGGNPLSSSSRQNASVGDSSCVFFYTPAAGGRNEYTEKARKLRKIRIDVCNQAARRALDIFMNRIIAL
jgi:hypothetical protein